MRLIKATDIVDCNNNVVAEGILKPVGGKVKVWMKVPFYTNGEDLKAGDKLIPPVVL